MLGEKRGLLEFLELFDEFPFDDRSNPNSGLSKEDIGALLVLNHEGAREDNTGALSAPLSLRQSLCRVTGTFSVQSPVS